MIRKGISGDFDALLGMCKRFWAKTEFDEPFEPEQSNMLLEMAESQGLLAVIDNAGILAGFSAGLKSPLMGNGSVFSGIELAWWVEPEYRRTRHGVKLFDYMESLARAAGIKYWCMASLQASMPGKVNAFYEKKGYHLSEMTYMKRLT